MHVEAGISGGTPFDERPEGGRLWAALQRGDTLVASKLDRMFRSAADCLKVVEAFKARGVSLYLLDLNGGADDVSGNGIARLFLTIVSAFAEFERNRTGERIRAAKRQARQR
jgi:DNA invertase Pin-like site-specific DNA recombinase